MISDSQAVKKTCNASIETKGFASELLDKERTLPQGSGRACCFFWICPGFTL
jgi:hypothetical protein